MLGQQAPGRMGVGIISGGKVGSALGSALRSVGHQIVGVYATSDASIERVEAMLPGVPILDVRSIVERSELVILALPDDELAPLVEGLAKLGAWQPGQIVVHTAGRYGASVLEPARRAGALGIALHPAMTFTGTSLDVARLQGCPFAVSAPAALLPIGQALATEMGGEPVVIAEADRAAYHFALSHGANHAVTLISQAMRVLEQLGVAEPGAFLRPLVEASVEGALRSGESLLTGPIVRGDAGTVAAHHAIAQELAAENPQLEDVPPTYEALAQATADRAHSRGVLGDAQFEEISRAISGN